MILNWILALVSAGLLVSVFPPFGYVWLAPLALAPLLVASAREDRWQRRFALGYVSGIVYWFGLCHWIQWTLEHHGGMGSAMAWCAFALFCLAKALQMGAFAVVSGLVTRKWFALPAIAALWTALEWTHSFTGFEWVNLGNAASDMPLLRLAPIAGVWGASFSFALMGAAIASLLLRQRKHASLWLLILPCIVFLPDLPDVRKGTATAVLVQPNIGDDSVWEGNLLSETERQMRTFSVAAAGRDSSTAVIAWPEVPAPFYESDSAFTDFAAAIAKDTKAALLTGVVARTPTGAPLNSALLFNPDGNRVSRYDKVNLVPFGEFVPWPFGLVTQKVSTEAGDFAAGSNIVISKVSGGHTLGTFICYESVFPSYIRKFAASGAQVLFTISNDSWFGKTAARYQHWLIVRMRAAENNRWIVRATNDGISGVIDPAGRTGLTLPEFREAAARVQYNYLTEQTFYTRHGDWFVLLCALISVAAIMSAVSPAHHRP